jgi:hypothetical protein
MQSDIFNLETAAKAQQKDLENIQNNLEIGTASYHLKGSDHWTATFGFNVLGAFIVPIDHFENIEGIDYIRPENIKGKRVTFTIRRKKPDTTVGVRVIAFGFGKMDPVETNGGDTSEKEK